MATSFRKFLEGLRIIPKTTSTASEKGDLDVTDSSGKLNYHNGTSASPVVTEDHQATLTNKTLTSPVLNTPTADTITGIAGGALLVQSATNEDLSLQAQGTGSVSLEAITVSGNTVTGGASTLTIQSDTDEAVTIQSQGTGDVIIQSPSSGFVYLQDIRVSDSTMVGLSDPFTIEADINVLSLQAAGFVQVEQVEFRNNEIEGGASADLEIISGNNRNLSLQAQGTGTILLESVTVDTNTITGGASTLTIQSANNQTLSLQSQGTGDVSIQTTGTGVVSVTSPAVVEMSSSSDALRITQTGSGNAFLVEDSTNPDSTPFVIDASGKVAIGATTPSVSLDLASTFATRAFDNLQTGVYVTVNAPTTSYIRLNGAITYLAGITRGEDGQRLTLSNKTGASITVLNNSGPAATDQYIITGTGADIIFEDDASIELIYSLGKWNLVGSVAGNLKVNTIAGSSLLTPANNVILADASLGAISLTLPASAAGKTFTVKKVDSTANLVSLVPASGTIDGTSAKTISGQYDSVQVVTDGSNWFII